MGSIRFGFGCGNDLELARELEARGVDLLSWGEAPLQFRDPYIAMARAADATTRARLVTSVTTPGLRHPAVHANSFLSVQEISGGRAICGIGTGDLALTTLGMRPFRLDSFLEYTSVLRKLMAGEPATWRGTTVQLTVPVERPVPVWFGADGPRVINAAGRLADGIIVGQMGSPDVVRTVVARAAAGAAEAGRSADEVEIWFVLRVLVTEREDGAVDVDGLDEYVTRALHYLWRTAGRPDAGHTAAAVLERRGLRLDDDVAERLWRFNRDYDESKAYGSKHNVELMDACGLREFGGRYFYISGPPEHILERVRELAAAGARNLKVVTTPGFFPRDRRSEALEMAEILAPLRDELPSGVE